jgi:hypothetical protein
MTRLVRSAAVLLVGSATVYGLGLYYLWSVDWTPLKRRIALEQGQHVSGSFVAQRNAMHVLELDTERRLAFERQNCLLGIESNYPERCATIPVELDVSWVVSTNGNRIASGSSQRSQGGYWGPTIGVVLGTFEGKRKQLYQVDVTVHRSSPELQAAGPTLQVGLDPDVSKSAAVWVGLSTFAAQLGVIVAVGLLVLATARSLWLRQLKQPNARGPK